MRTALVPPNRIHIRLEAEEVIKDYVAQLLETISSEIEAAIIRLACVVEVDAPTDFCVIGMRNEDAQRQVYYYTLRTLKEHGYNAGIRFLRDRVVFRVSWRSPEDEQRIQQMDDFIAQHTY